MLERREWIKKRNRQYEIRQAVALVSYFAIIAIWDVANSMWVFILTIPPQILCVMIMFRDQESMHTKEGSIYPDLFEGENKCDPDS